LKFLFWNLWGKPVDNILVQIIKYENIDVPILAEYVNEAKGLLRALAIETLDFYQVDQLGCKRIHVFD
jgi:hypothetical protein